MPTPSKKSPLAQVKDQFGGKDKLVDALTGLLESDQSKNDLRRTLLPVSNRKLLRLHAIASAVKAKFGSREKLVAATADALKRTKDKPFVTRLEGMSTGRLLDKVTAAERRNKRVAKATAKSPTKSAAK
jgi:hypothetical protein